MASSNRMWIALFVLLIMASICEAFGRAVCDPEPPPQSPESTEEPDEPTLRAGRGRRRTAETLRERCAELEGTWLENKRQARADNGTVLHLQIRSFPPRNSRRLVFPQKHLLSFARRAYRCCQIGASCKRFKGIQSRMRGDTVMEFVLNRETLSLTVTRAELHFQLSNPQHLEIHPVLPAMAKHGLATRYSLGSQGDKVDLRVDLLFLFQGLQEVAGGAGRDPSLVNMRHVVFSSGDPLAENPTIRPPQDTDSDVRRNAAHTPPSLDLGLVLGCSRAGTELSCDAGGVHLTHVPFVALYET